MKNIKCEICGSDKYKVIYSDVYDYNWGVPGIFNIVKCNKCVFVYINPRPDNKEMDRYYPPMYYIRSYKGSLDFKELKAVNKIHNSRCKFLKRFKSNGNLLDVGSGDGLFLNSIKDKGWKIHGVEPSKSASDFAKDKLRLEIYNNDLIGANLKENNFNVITMWEVLEHIPNLNENLKEVYKLLKQNGIFVASVPNFNSLQRVIFGKFWCGIDAPRHLYQFTPDTLKKLLLNNNFLNVKIYHSLINIKNPIMGYSDSIRYFLTKYNFYPKKVSLLNEESKKIVIPSNGFKYFIVCILHFVEFIVFSILEIFSFFLGKTGTIFVVARKK